MYTIEELEDKLVSELREIAESLEVPNNKKLAKQDLVYKILDVQSKNPEPAVEVLKSKTTTISNEDMSEIPKKRPRVKRENVKEIENSVETKRETSFETKRNTNTAPKKAIHIINNSREKSANIASHRLYILLI